MYFTIITIIIEPCCVFYNNNNNNKRTFLSTQDQRSYWAWHLHLKLGWTWELAIRVLTPTWDGRVSLPCQSSPNQPVACPPPSQNRLGGYFDTICSLIKRDPRTFVLEGREPAYCQHPPGARWVQAEAFCALLQSCLCNPTPDTPAGRPRRKVRLGEGGFLAQCHTPRRWKDRIGTGLRSFRAYSGFPFLLIKVEFSAYGFVSFDHDEDTEQFCCPLPLKFPWPLWRQSLLPLLVPTDLCSVSIIFAFPITSYKGSTQDVTRVWLLLKFIHIAVCVKNSFLFFSE